MDSNEYRELQEWDALRQIERNTRHRRHVTVRSRPLGTTGKVLVILTIILALYMIVPAVIAGLEYIASGGM